MADRGSLADVIVIVHVFVFLYVDGDSREQIAGGRDTE